MRLKILLAILLFEIGSLVCGVASNNQALIAGRAVTGVDAGGVINGSYCIVAFAVPPHKRPAFTGIMGATYGVASVVGPLLGGVFTDNASWHWCFYFNLPIGGVSALMILILFKSPEASRFKETLTVAEKILHMDFSGAIVILAAVLCYLYAIQRGGVLEPWSSPHVYGMFIGFGLLCILFVAVEWWQGPRALCNPYLLKQQHIWVGCVYSFFLGGGFFLLLYYLPIYFQAVLGTSAEQSGIRNLSLIVAETFSTIMSGTLVSTWGFFAPLMVLGSAIATVSAGLLYTLTVTSSIAEWAGYQVLAGLGIGFCFQVPIMAGQALAKHEDVPTTTALLMFFQTMGGALTVSAAQAAFGNELIRSLHKHAPDVSFAQVVAAGATEIRRTFRPDQVPGIILAYTDGLRICYIFIIGLFGVSLLVGFLTPWANIRTNTKPEPEPETEMNNNEHA